MSLPTSGSFGLSNIQAVFGGADPIGLTEYYRGGSYVTNKRALGSIPTTGQIKFSDFYGLGPNTSYLFNNVYQTHVDPTAVNGSDYFGESMAMNYDGTVLVVGSPGYDGSGVNSGRVYIFTRTSGGTWAQQTSLQGTDGVAGTSENFGNSVTIDAIGNTLAVGAYLSDFSGAIQNNGAVHIFTRTSGGVWTWQTRLNASDRSASDQFGYSVAINSDGTTLAVGAPYDDLTTPATGTDGGSVYIFTRTAGGTWAQQTRIQASDASTSDRFGWSVAINSDGTTIAAGAPLHNGTGGVDGGSIYFFTRTAGGTWAQQTTFQGAITSDQLGYSVAINSDATVAIAGAPFADAGVGRPDTGEIRVYTRTAGGTWANQATLNGGTSIIYASGYFGWSVAINYDGTLIAGGAFNDINGPTRGKGSVYIFTRTSGSNGWTQREQLLASDAFTSDHFGASLCMNYNGSTLVVGAPYKDSGVADVGTIYTFDQIVATGTTFAQQTRLQASDASSNDSFGYAVSINSDGTVLAVGAYLDDNSGGSTVGSVYIFTRTAGGTWAQTRIQASDAAGGDRFGNAVSINSDGTVIAVGAYNDDIGSSVNAGSAYIFTRTMGGTWAQQTRIQASDPATDDNFGWSVSINRDGTVIAVGAYNDDIGSLANAGSVYIFTRTMGGTWAQQTRLQASDASSNDQFGNAVNINSDGTVLAIGVRNDDNSGGTNAGSIYVFTRTAGGTWAQQTRLQASDAAPTNYFGTDVSINSDGTVIAVGAYFNDNSGGGGAGSVYIFTRTAGGTWAQQTRVQASDATTNDRFGWSVTINSDGTILAIGAPFDDNSGGTNAGSIYIFTRTAGGTWSEQTRVQASDGTISDQFGYSVSINSDGTTVAIGSAYDDNSGGTDAGSVYVFTRTASGTNYTQYAAQYPVISAAGALYGHSACVNNDGTVMAIGAYKEDNGAIADSGKVYIFTRTAQGSWTLTNALVASDSAASDYFGYSVAMDNFGLTLAVGAPYDDLTTPATGTDGGSVYIFTRTAGGTWAQQTRIQASDASTSDRFGWSVAINSDGTTIVAGAPLHNNGASVDAGSIYFFTRTAGGAWAQQTTFQGAAASDQLGYSVAINSDATVAIAGAPYVDSGAQRVDVGEVRIYTRTAGGAWASQANVNGGANAPWQSGYFGWSVAINYDGTVIAGGAYNDRTASDPITYAGAVYIFTRTAGRSTWTQQTQLRGSDTTNSDHFGSSVYLNDTGTTVVVGAVGNTNTGATNAGSVYVFTRNAGSSTWTQQTKLIASDAASCDDFGVALALSANGSTLVVGTDLEDNVRGVDAGTAYVFDQGSIVGMTYTQQTKLRGETVNPSDYFGSGISINSDGTVLAVGAYGDTNSGGTGAGSVYIFTRTPGGIWEQQTRLQASDAVGGGVLFGAQDAVSISNDGNTLVVGAQYATSGGIGLAGAAYVFTRTAGGSWIQTQRLQPSDPVGTGRYGGRISQNYDGTALVIGASTTTSSGIGSAGAAYVYTRSAGASTFTYQTRLQASDPATNNYFGDAVSMNYDGTVIAIGSANGRNAGGTQVGAVYIFTRTAGSSTWVPQTKLLASDNASGDYFGRYLSINANGTVLAIGALFDDNSGGTNAGSLYIFTRTAGGTWAEQTRLQASDAAASDNFGVAVSINSDGTTVVVGAYFDDNSGGTNAGSIYIFTRTAGGTWAEKTRLQAANASASDNFGYSVSINSNGTVVVAGAPFKDTAGAADAGAAFVFEQQITTANPYNEQTRLQASDASTNDQFGYPVSINSDGTTLAIGANYDDNSGGTNAGSVYIFTRTAGGTWAQQTRLQASDAAASDGFGISASINNDGTVVAIGSYRDDNSGGTGAGSVYIFTRTAGGTWAQQTRFQASDTSANDAFGYSVSINSDGTTIVVGANLDDNDNSGGINAGSAYVFTRTAGGTWAHQTKLQASDATGGDEFGYSVSINSDGTTVVVGAYSDDNSGGAGAGSVYIFTRTPGGIWTQQTRLQASDAGTSDYFGWSVSINSDGTTVVVGAYRDNNSGGADAGSVYIFTRTAGGTWAQQTRIQASDACSNDRFGQSVSINSDGTTIAVGSFYDDNSGGANAGSAYIFTRTAGGTWAQQTRIQASDASSSDQFGYSVSINSDGTTVAIGAVLDDNSGGTNAGSVYVFTQSALSDANYVQTIRLAGVDTANADNFGYQVAINYDGTVAVVGARAHDNSGGTDAGSAYVFTRIAGGDWEQQTRLQASDASASDNFGSGVSINADGTIIAIGAPNDDIGAVSNAGSVYIFTRTAGGAWAQQTRLQASDAAANDNFGQWAIGMNYDGTVLAVGAYLDDLVTPAATNGGSVYLFTRSAGGSTTWVPQTRIQAGDASSSDGFGWSLSMNADGTTLVVSSRYDDLVTPAAADAGSIYVFTRTAGGAWTQQTRLQASDAAASDHLGYFVSINDNGTVIAAGALNDDTTAGGVNAGSVYIFTRTAGGAWAEQTRLQASDGAASDSFGNGVALNSDGTVLLVGAYNDDIGSLANAGSAYIFTRTMGGTWAEYTRLQANDDEAGDNFANSVSISKDGVTLFIGSRYDNNGIGTDAGSAYVFTSTIVRN